MAYQLSIELGERDRVGGNGGPAIDDDTAPDTRRSMAEAQQDPKVHLRPSYLQRYAGTGAPAFDIVGIGGHGCFGRWLLLACGHWREIRDWETMPALGRKRPTRARCGCCRENIKPEASDLAQARAWAERV